MNIKETTEKYIVPSYNRFDLAIVDGKGSLVYDDNGKEYIDLGSGIAVNAFGTADKEWNDAIIAQLSKVAHTSNLYYTSPQAELAKLLCEKTGMVNVFFGNSGAEANECAIKAARKYSHDKYGDGRHTIITLKGSFHGRTITTLSATGQDEFHTDFAPFTRGFVHVTPNDFSELESVIKGGGIAAFMAELIQGESGVNQLDKEYVKKAAKLCADNDILFIADEVQTGNGRTGKLYCYMNYEIQPDIVTTAKGLGGGLPIGAALMGDKVKDTLGRGKHGSTFGGNPICAVGALNVLNRIDDKLLASVTQKGEYIKSELLFCKNVKSVSGMGLMLGIETEKSAKDIVAECMKKGVLVLTAKNKVRLLPALNIDEDILMKAITILKGIIES